ncbi:MAG: PKD domain-containing protein [Candidatus Thermoplasmatota archaeon]
MRKGKCKIIITSIFIFFVLHLFGCIGESKNGESKNTPPVVSISASPLSGCEPLTVSFTASATDPDGIVVSYYWNFKDGTTSTQPNPVHTFRAKGMYEIQNYEVVLTVTDNDGLTATTSITITVLLDTDEDSVPDINDIDDDNDGYLDSEDYIPKQDAKIEIFLESFKVIDYVDSYPNHLNAQIYFEIYINGQPETRAPSSGFWNVEVGKLETVNWSFVYNCPDNKNMHNINIRMYDKDEFQDDLLDIDGHDDTQGLTVYYNIQTNTWNGDDTDGVTDGSDDGTQYTDEDDCYLKYNIRII